LELAWHLTCGAMVWLVMIWPTPRMLATLISCGVLLLLEQGRQLRQLSARPPVVIKNCETAVQIQQTGDVDINAVRRAIIELTAERLGGGGDG
jgi:hypothetical protein